MQWYNRLLGYPCRDCVSGAHGVLLPLICLYQISSSLVDNSNGLMTLSSLLSEHKLRQLVEVER